MGLFLSKAYAICMTNADKRLAYLDLVFSCKIECGMS